MIAPLLALLLLQSATPQPTACVYRAGAVTLAVPGRPFVAEPTADGCFLFVPLATSTGGAVAVLENRGGAFQLSRTVPLGSEAFGAALSPDGATLAVAAGDRVILLDAGALRTASADPHIVELPVGAAAEAIEPLFTRDGARLFVSLERAASIVVIDVAQARDGTEAAMGRIPMGRAPVGLALSPDGARLYATSQVAGGELGGSASCPAEQGGARHPSGAVYAIDTARAATDPAHSVVGAASAGCNPVRVAVSPDGGRVWVTARGDGDLLGFDAGKLVGVSRAEPTVRLKVGTSPVGIAVRPDGAGLWVSASARFGGGDSGLVDIDASHEKPLVRTTLRASGFPRDLRILPDGRTLAAALYTGQAVRLEPLDATTR